jgi:chromosome segregation ATPase
MENLRGIETIEVRDFELFEFYRSNYNINQLNEFIDNLFMNYEEVLDEKELLIGDKSKLEDDVDDYKYEIKALKEDLASAESEIKSLKEEMDSKETEFANQMEELNQKLKDNNNKLEALTKGDKNV